MIKRKNRDQSMGSSIFYGATPFLLKQSAPLAKPGPRERGGGGIRVPPHPSVRPRIPWLQHTNERRNPPGFYVASGGEGLQTIMVHARKSPGHLFWQKVDGKKRIERTQLAERERDSLGRPDCPAQPHRTFRCSSPHVKSIHPQRRKKPFSCSCSECFLWGVFLPSNLLFWVTTPQAERVCRMANEINGRTDEREEKGLRIKWTVGSNEGSPSWKNREERVSEWERVWNRKAQLSA